MRSPWIVVVAAAALLTALAILHTLFWGWIYQVRSAHDELRFTAAKDGWRIAIARRAPRGEPRSPPVLLCHGLSANRFSLDFGVPRYSLALALADAGFDSFVLDLRGHGDSRRGRSRSWTFDTYLLQDIPAALDEIRSATGSERVLWVGHSQGALLGLVAASTLASRIAGVVAIAPPTHFHAHDQLRRLLPFSFLATGYGHRYLARAATPIAGWFHPGIAQFAWNSRNIDARIYRQVLANVVEDVPPRVLAQFLDWMRRDRFASVDGLTDYRAGLSGARQPALFISGSVDLLAPPAAVRAAFDLWAGEKEYWNAGKQSVSADYGHSDLIFGRRAPDEIYPRIVNWLGAHSVPLRPPARSPAPRADGAGAPRNHQ
ncbi:MAG TPA: alpha/beta hydrolase [Myxococcales bacterium]|nr:alpha/beta hydrolase [Myxococcales bacterium]